jgi:hypothetical protein
MKKFLFVIPQSPKRIITPFRQRLIDISLHSLLAQESENWEAWMLGEEDKNEGNLHFIRSPFETKEEKLHWVVDLLLGEKSLPEYIIRFDDDDIVNVSKLKQLEAVSFDCYTDKHHSFYDAASGRLSQQLRTWLPNTVIHKTEHALAQFGEYHYVVKSDKRRPHLLQNDHSKWWHQYYAGKNVVYADQASPLYLRILSPTSFTAQGDSSTSDRQSYYEYISKFGDWNAPEPKEFKPFVEELKKAWLDEHGALWELPLKKPGRSGISRWLGLK